MCSRPHCSGSLEAEHPSFVGPYCSLPAVEGLGSNGLCRVVLAHTPLSNDLSLYFCCVKYWCWLLWQDASTGQLLAAERIWGKCHRCALSHDRSPPTDVLWGDQTS